MIDCPEEMHSLASKERAMTQASYNDIAQWYDQFLRERPVYTEVILPNLLALVGEVEGEVICDLACGQGWVARELAQHLNLNKAIIREGLEGASGLSWDLRDYSIVGSDEKTAVYFKVTIYRLIFNRIYQASTNTCAYTAGS